MKRTTTLQVLWDDETGRIDTVRADGIPLDVDGNAGLLFWSWAQDVAEGWHLSVVAQQR